MKSKREGGREGGRKGGRTYLIHHLPLCEKHELIEELEDGVARLMNRENYGLPRSG